MTLAAKEIHTSIADLIKRRSLIGRLVKRELDLRHRGSVFGALWTVLSPLILIAIYGTVFEGILQVRWGEEASIDSASVGSSSLRLFAGLVVFNFLSEVIFRSPTLISANPVFVKKVVFPTEILPVVIVLCALANTAVAVLILLLATMFVIGVPPLSAFLIPVVLVPPVLIALGLAWSLAAIGVYLRDVQQGVGFALMALMFLSPIFYPVGAVPVSLQPVILASPLTVAIEELRKILFLGQLPDALEWLAYAGISMVICFAGLYLFLRVKDDFADVI